MTDRPVGEIDPRDRERAKALAAALNIEDCECFDCPVTRGYRHALQQIAEALSQVRQESQQEIASLKAEMRRMYSRVEYNSARAEIEEPGERAETTEARLRDLELR